MTDLVIEYAEPGQLIALDGDQRVGILRWQVIDTATVEIIELAYSPDWADLAGLLTETAEEVAAEEGYTAIVVDGVRRRLPEIVDIPTAEAMQALGVHLGGLFRPGDVVIATGGLGAGKTTLTQGIGVGLGVNEPITSPTFVLARIHPGAPGRPDLVHVDAYRLADGAELDDIDLDHDLDRSVTVIEWGAGIAEQLSDARLEIDIGRSDDPTNEVRRVVLRPIGARWDGIALVGEGSGT